MAEELRVKECARCAPDIAYVVESLVKLEQRPNLVTHWKATRELRRLDMCDMTGRFKKLRGEILKDLELVKISIELKDIESAKRIASDVVRGFIYRVVELCRE